MHKNGTVAFGKGFPSRSRLRVGHFWIPPDERELEPGQPGQRRLVD